MGRAADDQPAPRGRAAGDGDAARICDHVAATKEFERALLSRRIAHSGHAVLRWCVGNVVLDEDAAGNVKPNKARSPDRIDGAVAAVMALARAAAAQTGPSIYDDADARPEGFVFI